MKALTQVLSKVSSVFVDGWLLMLLVGDMHHVGRSVPALGYWLCVFAAFILAGISGTGTLSLYWRLRDAS